MRLRALSLSFLLGFGGYHAGTATIQQDESNPRYEVLERWQDRRIMIQSSLAISVPRILGMEETKTVICDVWETDLSLKDAEFSVIDVYFDITRDEYMPGIGTFTPPSSTERNRLSHKFATYRWSDIVKPAMRRLTMIKNMDGTPTAPLKDVKFRSHEGLFRAPIAARIGI